MDQNEEIPSWPAGEKGQIISDFIIEMPMDQIFTMVHSGGETEFRVRLYSFDTVRSFSGSFLRGSLLNPPSPLLPILLHPSNRKKSTRSPKSTTLSPRIGSAMSKRPSVPVPPKSPSSPSPIYAQAWPPRKHSSPRPPWARPKQPTYNVSYK